MSDNVKYSMDVEAAENRARKHLLAAAQILKQLGPDRARIGWMLEDTMMYLDELKHQEEALHTTDAAFQELERIAKLANG